MYSKTIFLVKFYTYQQNAILAYMAASWIRGLNLKKTCSEYRVGLWQCPQFLFLLMGIIIILAILVTYIVASRYQEPELAALTVLVLTAILFTIGNLIVNAFERVALAARSKSEFISIMSHQLRSPLSAIKWQLDLLLSGNHNNTLETIYAQNERMIQSVNDLLEVNRIEDNDLILRPTPSLIKEITQKVVAEYKHFAAANNVNIEIQTGESIPKILVDSERIRHVIEHLLDNAVKYSVGGGKIIIDISTKANKLIWTITDHGAGISSDDQKRIFDKFFRSDHVLRYQTEGAGVGLFIARAIIEQSGGDIGFSSAINKGSTFWFTLPMADKITN